MAFQISPGVVTNERDETLRVPGEATAFGATAGVFRWGPVNERVLIDSEANLINRFGKPTNINPETFFSAAGFLAYASSLWVTRAANTTGVSPIVTANIELGNTSVSVGNTSSLSNGMILMAASNVSSINVGTTITVTNATHISLASSSDAFANEEAVSLQFVSNTTTYNAIVNTAAVSNLTNQIIKTGDSFDTKFDSSDFDSDVVFIAKWPGAIGNSLKISVCDSSSSFESNIGLSNTGNLTGNISFGVDSNTATVSIGANSDLTTFDVNTFNSFAAAVIADVSVGDVIVSGNTLVGQQHIKVTAVGSVSNVTISANSADTINVSSGTTAVDSDNGAFALLDAGDFIAVFSNATSYTTHKIASVADSNTAVLETNGAFTNTASDWAPISGTTASFNLSLEDKYKKSQNTSLTSIQRKWEFFDVFDVAPGQTSYVLGNGNTSANDEIHVVVVDEDGKFTGVPGSILEKFEKLSRATDSTSEDGQPNYYKTEINQTSKYVWIVNDRSGAASANGANIASSINDTPLTSSFKYGTDGSDESTIAIGVLSNAWDLYVPGEEVDVSLLIAGKARGGTAGGQLANYLIDNIAEVRKDCVVFVSPDRGDVVNNEGSEAVDVVSFRDTLRSTSYAFLDSGYKYTYDRYNNLYRYIPLNGDMAGLTARTEHTNDAWWSPAGLNRGKIKNIIRLAYNPRKADRDLLYKNGVNPVINMKGEGHLLLGDKTLLAKPSAFDRINVRRLFIVLEKSISASARYILFEFNDAFTRAAFRNLVIPYLRTVQGRRGITDFLVVCDSTNNPPDVIDRNEFVGDIYIKPARSINFITLNFIATPTGVAFTELITPNG